MAPVIIAGVFYIAVAFYCLARPVDGRIFVGLFFWVMALGIHGYIILFNPQSYVDFAHSAHFGFYRDLASPVVEFSPRGFGLLCLIFEATVGALILSKGRPVKLGLLAGIVFLLAITPLGKEELVNPILALALATLLVRDFDESLADLLRQRTEHPRHPHAPA